MLKKFHDALLANYDIVLFNEYFNKVIFMANQSHFLAVALNKLNLDEDDNFDEDDLDTIIHSFTLVWRTIFEKCKTFKKK